MTEAEKTSDQGHFPPPRPAPTGVLVIDKPLGMTSTHLCRVVKRRLINGGSPKRVKVGHGGTLDPLATGIVVILIGKATRLCEKMMAGEKRYIAEIDLSRVSTTDDGEGVITTVQVPTPPDSDAVGHACAGFAGWIMQRPPIYSALKVGGRAAYHFARSGEELKLEPRAVEIKSLEIVSYEWPRLVIDVACGRGVYIRSLARDIGAVLGTGGMLTALRRTRVGRFTLDQAIPIEAVPNILTQPALMPVDLA
ncbi:MAG: tRNA pseudouridine(55) synthase TruB [Phycisphaerales bacterium]|nr:tRNA pseudouridine(55) synthase TruB [Phycisphaerales bacterium]